MSDSSASSFMTVSSDLPSQWWDTEEHKTKRVMSAFKDALLAHFSILYTWVSGAWDGFKQSVAPVQGAASTGGIMHGPAGQIGCTNQGKVKKIVIGVIVFFVTGVIAAAILFSALRREGNFDYGTYEDGSTENGQPNLQDW
ncbi:hypothetical protein FB451DRAFT_1188412 [Mycena latifolia]|nr:hypothetical protein FB451DRAFT_1188412 [Mycena latifolia]